MAKIFLRDVGSRPERDLEVTLFQDGELQFEADNGKYVHINITREGVSELIKFLLVEAQPTKRAPDARKSALKKVSSKSKGSVKPARG